MLINAGLSLVNQLHLRHQATWITCFWYTNAVFGPLYFILSIHFDSKWIYPQDTDCVVTAWSPWSDQCSSTCGQGHRLRFRSVTVPSTGHGRPCPHSLQRYKRCRLPSCPVDHCNTNTWSHWGPCSATCGSSGVQVWSPLKPKYKYKLSKQMPHFIS